MKRLAIVSAAALLALGLTGVAVGPTEAAKRPSPSSSWGCPPSPC